jgi:hypothetical protein
VPKEAKVVTSPSGCGRFIGFVMCLLEALHNFIKFSQLIDIFVCDFIVIVKIYQGDVIVSIQTHPRLSSPICYIV